MRIIILGNWENELNKIMDEVFEEFGLFTILVNSPDSVGYKWAKENGAPIEFMNYFNIKRIDYAVIKWDGKDNAVRRIMLMLKEEGKHGVVSYK